MVIQGEDSKQVCHRTRPHIGTCLVFRTDVIFPQSISKKILDDLFVPKLAQEFLNTLGQSEMKTFKALSQLATSARTTRPPGTPRNNNGSKI